MCIHLAEEITYRIVLVTESEWEKLSKARSEWIAAQPEYIAVKMSNEEMCVDLEIQASSADQGYVYAINDVLFSYEYKIIDAALYKKTENPKILGEPVIPWEDN